MTHHEYLDDLNNLTMQFEQSKKELAIKYALKNNPVKIGDILTDIMDTIEVTDIQVVVESEYKPFCRYSGFLLKANGERYSDLRKQGMYQGNVRKHRVTK